MTRPMMEGMKRAILVGAIAFTLGAVSSPKAANDGETLRVLCQRFDATAGKTLANLQKTHEAVKDAEARGGSLGAIVALEAMRTMVCVK